MKFFWGLFFWFVKNGSEFFSFFDSILPTPKYRTKNCSRKKLICVVYRRISLYDLDSDILTVYLYFIELYSRLCHELHFYVE